MNTKRGLGPDGTDELEQLAAKMGPNNGHFKRMRLEHVPPVAAAPRGRIAPNAPTSRAAPRWKKSELIAGGVAGIAAIVGLGAAVIGIAMHDSNTPKPPPPAPNKPARTRP